jgi:heme-degrading monooxygenase HmoA
MSTLYTTGSWKPYPGSEGAFVEAWTEFAAWASGMPGAGELRLARNLSDPERYVSFGDWDGVDAVRSWKSSPEFRERMARVREHVAEFQPDELALVATATQGAATIESGVTKTVHYKKDGIATFDAPADKLFRYMSAGNHPHAAFKSHRLVGVAGNLVTVAAEVYNPDGSTFQTTIEHRLDPPSGLETTMTGGPFDGARFAHSYTPLGDRTRVDLEGDFPALPGMSEAEELAMIDGFLSTAFAEDTETLRTWAA